MADIVLDQVDKIYDNGYRAITNLNLTIDDGSFLVLVGPSGCGKSTALRMVAGLEDITGGELRIGGRRVNEAPPRERDIAMVFQSYALYPHLSVYENIAFGLRLRKMNKKEIDSRVRHAADVLGLTEFLDRKPRVLSGGQRQRVAMGRAIVREPSAFLMDEPLSNLDAKLRGQMRNEVAKLQKELGVTTLYVTHDQIEAMTMGDRVAVINGGILQQVGTPRDIYVDPDNLFVAGFMGSPPMNQAVADVEIEGDQVVVVVGGQRLTVDPELVNERPAAAGLPRQAGRRRRPARGRARPHREARPPARSNVAGRSRDGRGPRLGAGGPLQRGHRADSDVEARGWTDARRTGADLDDVGGDVQPARLRPSRRDGRARGRDLAPVLLRHGHRPLDQRRNGPASVAVRAIAHRRASAAISSASSGEPHATTKPPSAADAAVAAEHHTAGRLDDGHRTDDVVGLQSGVDDDVDVAHRQLGVGVAVAAVAHEAGAPAHRRRTAPAPTGSVNIDGVVQ